MDDTAEKTISAVSKSADEEFSMEMFKDTVRYLGEIEINVDTLIGAVIKIWVAFTFI